MTVIASTLSLLTTIFVVVVSFDIVNGTCQPASRDYQTHQGNFLAFYPSPLQDNALKDTIYQVKKASSDVVCAVHCLQDNSCKSFNYCNDKVCHLKAANYSVKGLEIQFSAGCRHYGDEEGRASLCGQKTPQFKNLELRQPMTSPMRLEFTANFVGWSSEEADCIYVSFSPDGPGIGSPMYTIDLCTAYADISQPELYSSNPEVPLSMLYYADYVNYIGVPVTITYDNGRFEVAVQGVPDSYQNRDVTYPPPPSWFVSFRTKTEAELNFTEPCINNFDPQFTSQ